ncbi:MAG TPA: hypothetical protein VFD92_07425 [Candidatus Binatia bacterium]|nr:hypothetical protein [Candidatus Binatia bacterium]
MDTFRTGNRIARAAIQTIVGLSAVVGLTFAAPTSAHAKTKFYLTQDEFPANGALTACAGGYHMASLWEILELGSLKYDSSRGFVTPDAGSGPPSTQPGWVRTGYYPYSGSVPGGANCALWTSISGTDYGTSVMLEPSWAPDAVSSRISPWRAGVFSCDRRLQVWCVHS